MTYRNNKLLGLLCSPGYEQAIAKALGIHLLVSGMG
jgi:hypothetical protein